MMMTYTLENLIDDCRNALATVEGPQARERIRRSVEHLLANRDFVAEHCGPDANAAIHTLYQDATTGFVVLVHIYEKGKTSPPHDHGSSWAVYGQAVSYTDMTVWERVDDQTQEGYAELKQHKRYRLNPGMAGTFEPGDIHSIHFPSGARFVRVTGTDLSQIPTRHYDLDRNTVTISDRS